MLVGIIIVAAAALYIAEPTSPGFHFSLFGANVNQDFPIRQGLDLQGGIQVLLQADVPPGQTVDQDAMNAAVGIVQSRVNALGVSEPLVQPAGGNRIVVELPGVKDPDAAIQTIGQTGTLEFIDAGSTFLPTGTVVTTTLGGTSAAASTPTAVNSTPTPASPFAKTTFKTVLTGKDLQTASVGFDQVNRPEIDFVLTSSGGKAFADYTSANVGKYLAITMDKKVIECPVIQS